MISTQNVSRISIVLMTFVATVSWSCSRAIAPVGLQTAQVVGSRLEGADAGTDAVAPSAPRVEKMLVRLIKDGCNGAGISCVEPDALVVNLDASTGTDDVTADKDMRFLISFGETAEQAQSNAYTHLFQPDNNQSHTFTADLTFGGIRSGKEFDQKYFCFALAAVDNGGNVSARSSSQCIDTTDGTGGSLEVIQGNSCLGKGCAVAPASLMGLWLLGIALLRRRVFQR